MTHLARGFSLPVLRDIELTIAYACQIAAELLVLKRTLLINGIGVTAPSWA